MKRRHIFLMVMLVSCLLNIAGIVFLLALFSMYSFSYPKQCDKYIEHLSSSYPSLTKEKMFPVFTNEKIELFASEDNSNVTNYLLKCHLDRFDLFLAYMENDGLGKVIFDGGDFGALWECRRDATTDVIKLRAARQPLKDYYWRDCELKGATSLSRTGQ